MVTVAALRSAPSSGFLRDSLWDVVPGASHRHRGRSTPVAVWSHSGGSSARARGCQPDLSACRLADWTARGSGSVGQTRQFLSLEIEPERASGWPCSIHMSASGPSSLPAIAAGSPASASELGRRNGPGWWAGGAPRLGAVRAQRAGAIGGSRPATSPPAGDRGASVLSHPSTSSRQCRPSPPTPATHSDPEGRRSTRPGRSANHPTPAPTPEAYGRPRGSGQQMRSVRGE